VLMGAFADDLDGKVWAKTSSRGRPMKFRHRYGSPRTTLRMAMERWQASCPSTGVEPCAPRPAAAVAGDGPLHRTMAPRPAAASTPASRRTGPRRWCECREATP
jgi:hypothetical protein